MRPRLIAALGGALLLVLVALLFTLREGGELFAKPALPVAGPVSKTSPSADARVGSAPRPPPSLPPIPPRVVDDASDGLVDDSEAPPEEARLELRGCVVDSHGRPVADDDLVVAIPEDVDADVGADGCFVFTDLAPGRYLVVASLGRSRATAEGDAGGSVRLVLPGAGRLRGRVTDARGLAVRNFRVTAFNDDVMAGDEVARGDFDDPEGRFELPDVPAGRVRVTASSPGWTPVLGLAAVIEPERETWLDIRLTQGGRVVGTVVDGATRRALQATIAFDSSRAWRSGAGVAAQCDAEGRFSLGGVPPGIVSLRVEAGDHYTRLVGNVTVPESGESSPVDVALTPLPSDADAGLELGGIGATLAPDGRALGIAFLWPGSGGSEAGLAVGDAILAVDGVPVTELGLDGAMARIRGPEDTSVTLTIARGAAPPRSVLVWRKLVRS